MKSQEDVEKLLTDLGKCWPNDSSLAERVMREIQSSKPRPKSSSKRRIIMKSIIGIAASVAIIASVWWGVLDNKNSLYAQVIDAVHKARTFHTIQYVQPKDGAQPIKASEAWYERGVGFRQEGFGLVHIGNEEYFWTFAKDRMTATRSLSNGIDKATVPVFVEIDRFVQELRNEYEPYPNGNQTIDGEPCKAYILTKMQQYMDEQLKTGKLRVLIYLDPQSRLVRVEHQWLEDNHWDTKNFISYTYDEPIDPALFKPDFGKDVKIVDADKAFDEFVDLKKAVYTEQRDGLIFAIHRIERFENGDVLVVSSVRGTEETLKKYPLTKRRVRPGQFLTDGPATVHCGTGMGIDCWYVELATASHQGIDLCWWVMIPRGERPNFFEVSPGKIKIPVHIAPHGDYAKLFLDERGITHELTWNVELDVPRPSILPTLEEITNRIYADQISLESVPFKSLSYSDKHEAKVAEVGKITPAEYTKLIADTFHSCWEMDIEGQLDRQFEPEQQKQIKEFMGDRVAISLSYYPIVNDTTLDRIAKRKSVTELYLQGTRITDNGLKQISGLKKLQILHLEDTSITDAGLKYLTSLSNLKHLDLTDTKVTTEGVAMLKKAIPNVEIQWKADDK